MTTRRTKTPDNRSPEFTDYPRDHLSARGMAEMAARNGQSHASGFAEAAYRRAAQQIAFFLREQAKKCGTLGEVISLLCKATDLTGRMRNSRKKFPFYLHTLAEKSAERRDR